MRALVVFIITALAACAPTGQPAPASPDTVADATATDANLPADDASDAAAQPEASDTAPVDAPATAAAVETMELVRGKRVEAHGVRIMLRGTSTQHRSTTVAVIRAEVEVRKGDEEQTVSLEREQPGDAKFVEVLGLALGLESVDASAKPSTAQILVRP